MNELFWIVQHPITNDMKLYRTLRGATSSAIAANQVDEDHPAFRLYRCARGRAQYVGVLWRAFGQEFNTDPDLCWLREPQGLMRR